jgi:pimeloyl-ACP methyl ester carboxylesterase
MLTATPVHPEGPRYAASIAYLAGLWVPPAVWRPAATYLGHRGWAGRLLDTRAVRGGIAARADAVAAHLAKRDAPAVLVAHDAGAAVALAVAEKVPVRALVLVAPLVPGTAGTHALTWSRGLPWALVRRRPIGPPRGRAGEVYLGGLANDVRAAVAGEDPRVLSELARRSRLRRPAHMPPTLVLRGAADPIVSDDDVRRLAGDLGADLDEIPAQGHWVLAAPAWQECVHRVHRWLVQRLGQDNLELYAEAMADRDDDAGER